jgi:hypothetical protein
MAMAKQKFPWRIVRSYRPLSRNEVEPKLSAAKSLISRCGEDDDAYFPSTPSPAPAISILGTHGKEINIRV